MKNVIFVVSSLVLALVLTPGMTAAQTADAPEGVIHDAESAMAFLKTLSGDWVNADQGTEHGTTAAVASYKVAAAGSAVIETTGAGTPSEMTTVFHMDGDQLLQTHYCALMNAPVMRFEPSATPGELKFVFHGGTNFDPDVDMHQHEGTIQIKDLDTFERGYVVYANGKMSSDGAGLLKRAKPATN